MRRLFVFAVLAAGFLACSSFGSESTSPPPPAGPPPNAPPPEDGATQEDGGSVLDAIAPFCATPAPSDELYCEDFDEGLPKATLGGYGDGCKDPTLTTVSGSQAIESIKVASKAGSGCASYYAVATDGSTRKVRVSLDARVVASAQSGYSEFLNIRGKPVLDGGSDASASDPAVALVVFNAAIKIEGPQGGAAAVNQPASGALVHYDLVIDLDAGPGWFTASVDGKKVTLSGLPATAPFVPPLSIRYGLPYADADTTLDVVIDNVRVTTQ